MVVCLVSDSPASFLGGVPFGVLGDGGSPSGPVEGTLGFSTGRQEYPSAKTQHPPVLSAPAPSPKPSTL